MKKLIIVMNGKGGVGKDTLCDGVAEKYKVTNISSIEPIKEIAAMHGWKGEKTPASRRFLAELKAAFVNYNDLPTVYLKQRTEEFLESDNDVLFVHIREGDQIDKYRQAILPAKSYAVLIKRKAVDELSNYGNAADDEVENYNYDKYFHNDNPIDQSVEEFLKLVEELE